MYTFHQIHVSIPFPLKDLYKHVFQIVSLTLLQGVGRAKIYMYNATPGGGRAKKKKLLPVRRKCAGCGQWGLDRCQCQVKTNGTPGDKYRGHLGEK